MSLGQKQIVTVMAVVATAIFLVSAFAVSPRVSASSSDDLEPMQSKSTSYAPAEAGWGWPEPAGAVVIQGVPAYLWYNGCGPTAVGMVVGYWDAHGFDDLIPGEAALQNEYVNRTIASEEHIADYAMPYDSYWIYSDKSTLGGAHASNCIADFMHTSWSSDGNAWGWSWSDMVDDGFSGYVHWANPSYTASSAWATWNLISWDRYVHEINSGHPVVFLVDSNADGYTDHFVTAIGYGAIGTMKLYGCLDTWDLSIHWFPFAKMAKGQIFGIYDATILEITKAEAHCVSKATSRGTTCASWTVSGVSGTYSLKLDNNGFKSAVVDILDVSSGPSVRLLHQSVVMRAAGAYPFGWAVTSSVQLDSSHTYLVTIGGLDGPVGSYLVAYPNAG